MPSSSTSTRRPSSVVPSAVATFTSRVRLRRQCRGAVSGRSTPGEVTSRTYGAPPIASDSSSAAETAVLTPATVSRPTPPSRSTTTRSSRRLPAGVTTTSSRSSPWSATTGSSSLTSESRSDALPTVGPPRSAVVALPARDGCPPALRLREYPGDGVGSSRRGRPYAPRGAGHRSGPRALRLPSGGRRRGAGAARPRPGPAPAGGPRGRHPGGGLRGGRRGVPGPRDGGPRRAGRRAPGTRRRPAGTDLAVAAPDDGTVGVTQPRPCPPPSRPPASWLADLERAAARRRTTEALRAGPDLARLLAAVGASESAHAALLEQADR